MHPRALQLIEQLKLAPHPEGGFYREVYRTEQQVHSDIVGETRAALTDIYFLLPAGQFSRWHRVAHDELWNYHDGAPLAICHVSPDLTQLTCRRLDPQSGQFKQLVPAGYWQAAETLGEYSLVGCSVAPGFDIADFRMLRDLPETAARIYAEYPEMARFI